MASDADRKIATEYGLSVGNGRPGMKDVRGAEIGHPFIERVTFVIGRDHKILAVLSSKEDKLAPDQHVHRALAIVQKLGSE